MDIFLTSVLILLYIGILAYIICRIFSEDKIADKCIECTGVIAFITVLIMVGYCIFNVILQLCISSE